MLVRLFCNDLYSGWVPTNLLQRKFNESYIELPSGDSPTLVFEMYLKHFYVLFTTWRSCCIGYTNVTIPMLCAIQHGRECS